MDSKQLLLVSPRFWPISGSRELLATGLAEELASMGHRVTVLTGRIARVWPESFEMGEVQVVRLPKRRDGLLDSLRRMARRKPWHDDLNRWLTRHHEPFDFAIVIAGRDDTDSTVECLRRVGLPAVVRRDDSQGAAEPEFENPPNSICWVNPALADGTDDRQGISIPDGVVDNRQTILSRQQIRASLQTAHPLFELRDDALLAVCPAKLLRETGMFELVTAWRAVLSRFPTARLWLTGEGDDGYELFQRIRDLEMEHAVILPGNFDEIHDVLEAADAIIMPGRNSTPEWYVRSALTLGVPLLCNSRNRFIRQVAGAAAESGCVGLARDQEAGTNGSAVLPGIRMFDDSAHGLESVLLDWADDTCTRERNGDTRRGGPADADVPHGESANSLRQMAEEYLVAGCNLVAGHC